MQQAMKRSAASLLSGISIALVCLAPSSASILSAGSTAGMAADASQSVTAGGAARRLLDWPGWGDDDGGFSFSGRRSAPSPEEAEAKKKRDEERRAAFLAEDDKRVAEKEEERERDQQDFEQFEAAFGPNAEREAREFGGGPSAPPPEPCPEGIRGFDCEDDARNTRTFGTIEDGMVGCVTETVTQEVEKSGDAEVHAKAIAEVFALACKEGNDVTADMFDEVFKSEDAFAFAETMSKSIITCYGLNVNAYHCYEVTASAKAYAEATASAHAEAVGRAVNACGCMTEAVADSIADTDLYLKLIAEAASTATAEVCVDGTEFEMIRADAFEQCSSKIYGKVFAKAVAEAIVKGNCLNSEAISEVLAEVGATFDAESTCGLTATAILI